MPESPNDTTVGFYDLPNEARKKIYEGVLKLPHPIFSFKMAAPASRRLHQTGH